MSYDTKRKITLVTGILVYIAFIVYIACLAKVCYTTKETLWGAVAAVKFVLAFMELIVIIDATLIFLWYDATWWKLLLSVVFMIFYPLYRENVVGSKYGIGKFLVGAFFLAIIALVFMAGRQANPYGNLEKNITDKETLDEAKVLMNQKAVGDKTYSFLFVRKNKFTPDNAKLSKNDNKYVLVLYGKGNVDVIENDIGACDIEQVDEETKLTFEKTGSNEYNLKKVVVGRHELTKKEKETYFEWITGQ